LCCKALINKKIKKNKIVNVAEEAVAEELLPYKELFTSVVPRQDHKTAATSCFCVQTRLF